MFTPASCPVEISSLPVLSGCPPDDSYILLFNINSPQAAALIPFSTMVKCILTSKLHFVNQLFVVPRDMAAGLDTLLITQTNVIPDSGFITFGGTELPPDDATPIISNQLNCTITYPAGGIQFAFNEQMQNNFWFIIHYAYYQ